MLMEASQVMPNEPNPYPMIPFYPSTITTGSSLSTLSALDSSSDDWKAYPDKLDLFWWQGDDVQIQLQFQGDTDMSDWTWEADVRSWPTYWARLNFTFVVSAQFVPADLITEIPAHTTVTLFVPRQLNWKVGKGSWELHSISPYEGPVFEDPPPEGVDDANWPPTTQLKTWVYGNVTVVPRTNDTDTLPIQPVVTDPVPFPYVISSYGFNGRNP